MADLKQIKVGDTTYNIEPYTSYLPRAGGKMTGNIRMSENTTSIIFRDTSANGDKSWLSGVYANSTGDEVLGIVVKNARTHIMLGNADPEARPACTSLTPAIDIKNGKVGINKRLGTDSSADAGSYNLDVNGSINASGTIDANSARISNGLYVGTSITHNDQENLNIGNSDNRAFVNFVEDISGSGWSISVDGEAEFDTILEQGVALPHKYAPKEWISVYKTSITAPASASATGSLAIGYGSTAGARGIAIGESVSAASNSVAIGSSVGGTGGVSIGPRTTAYGEGVVIGDLAQIGITGQTWSSANGNIAIGKNAVAIGCTYAALAVGHGAIATGQTTIALGYSAKAYTQPTTGSVSGYGAIAIGGWANASGNKAIAIGPCSTATHLDCALAIGFGVSASQQHTIAMGTSVKATNPNSIAIGYTCCGATSSVAIGNYCYASGTCSVAIGCASASGYYSVAVGSSTAGTTGSVAIGYNSYANTGASTIAIGQSCYATGNYCISVGYQAKSAQTGSIAMGYYPTASGTYSIAIGMYAAAYKQNSIAIGYGARATGSTSGYNSVVIGPSAKSYTTNTNDSTYYSILGNTVIGSYMMATGWGNVVVGVGATGALTTVSGSCNIVIARPTNALASFTGTSSVRSSNGILIGSGSISGTSAIAIRQASNTTACYGTYLGGALNTSHTGASYLVVGANDKNYCYKTSAGASWTSASDIRDKTDIQSLTGGLEFISKITPITYVDNARTKYSEDGDITYNEDEHQKGTKKGTRRIAGVSAQETYSAQQEIYGTDNYGAVVDWSRHDHPDELEFDRYWIQYERFIPYLIDAVKTLNQKVCDLENEIKNLKSS